jgi:hypothetical protein
MLFWNKWRQNKQLEEDKRKRVLAVHDRLVDHLFKVIKKGGLGVVDGYDLRFDLMVFMASNLLYCLRDDPEFSQDFWEVVFEGFQESLRHRGVTDIRMAAKMKQTMQDATGRRNIYVVAWENEDEEGIREAIARNILNGAKREDSRIDTLIGALEGFPGRIMDQ